MKKFLGKKATFITCLVVAIVMLALVIFMCVRPVSAGLTYQGKVKDAGVETTVKYKIWGNTMTASESSKVHGKKNYMSMDTWVYRDGDEAVMVGYKKINKVIENGENKTKDYKELMADGMMGKAAYKDAVKVWKDLKKQNKVAYTAALQADDSHMEISAFKLKNGEQTYTCVSAIVLVVIFAVVDAAAITFTVLSVLERRKKA